MGRHTAKIDYEDLRNARILENKARLASIGLQKTLSELRSVTSPKKPKRKWQKVDYTLTPLRRSSRLKRTSPDFKYDDQFGLRRFYPIRGNTGDSADLRKGRSLFEDDEEEREKRPANAPFVSLEGYATEHRRYALEQRCTSKGRGSVYDPVFGICCHLCRQKKLCGEEDCKRCGDLDMDQPCLGKTDCSVCHSSNGVLCRACLKVRYGEEMEEVRENKEWMCPHCIEEKGIKPYWICNSSFCLKKRKMVPTWIAIFRAREMGYESVAHFLMDELRIADKGK